MASSRNQERRPEKPSGPIAKLMDGTIGNAFRLVWWSICAIFVSIIIEWIGMIFIWELDHSQQVLDIELTYLNDFSRNLLLNVYPGDLAALFIGYAAAAVSFIGLDNLRPEYESNVIFSTVGYGLQSMVNIVMIFSVRLAMVVSSITGFIVIAILAFADGLTEREIRRDCGGIEVADAYHHAKRWMFPSMMLAFGLYLTIPISIHPTIVFLPAMFITGLSVYVTASRFKKFFL